MARHSAAAEFPLHLSEVLEQEFENLVPEEERPDEPCGRSPWDFTPNQIHRAVLPGLLARLRKPGDAVCALLRKRSSSLFRDMLHDQEEDPGEEVLREALAEELNRLLREDDFHRDLADACRKDGIRLSEEMEMLLADPPADRERLHRLLLEEALPEAFGKVYDQRLAAAYQRVHRHGRGLTALCLSGGGIRSAVFSLGVVQGLARHRLLHRFDYLSTVSGGGYLGGLLSAWIHRHPRGIDGVSDELAGASPAARKLQPEPAPIEYLRNFSNYLSPKLGILSADSWTLLSIYARNLYLHWLVMVPLLLALLTVPRLYVSLLQKIPRVVPLGIPFWAGKENTEAFLWPDGLFVAGSLLMTIALAYVGWNRPSGGQRSTTRGFLLLCLLPLALSAVALTTYWAWYRGLGRPFPGWLWFIGPSVLINLTGWSVHALPALVRGRVRPLAKLREIPFLIVAGALGGVVAMLAARVPFLDPLAESSLPWYAVFAVPTLFGAFVVGETLFAGLASRWTDDEDREWWSRSAAWMLIVAVAWVAVSGVVIFGPVLLAHGRAALASVGGLAGAVTALLAHSSLTRGSAKEKEKQGWPARLVDAGLAIAAPVFVLVLLSALSLGVSLLLVAASGLFPSFESFREVAAWHLDVVRVTELSGVAVPLLFTLGFGLVTALLIDINKFSLHAMYRNRLIRTFLGASRENRSPSEFTGFDAEDNLEMWRLRGSLFLRRQNLEPEGARLCLRLKDCVKPPSAEIVARHLSAGTRRALQDYCYPDPPSADLLDALVEDFNRMIAGRFDDELLRGLAATEEEVLRLQRARSGDERFRRQRDLLLRAFQEEIDTARPPRPLHVVNVALNLVGGKKLAWQQRKAESFTFSPLHCGSARLGYRAAELYGRGGLNRRAVSLGTAMAISGAAASPNMGYHSSPAITFLLTFFNARLGWWLGNPGVAGASSFGHSHPRLAVSPLISEALGLTDDRSPYVYLSDGGHFENLGLYEMVLRRCRQIVVVDAGQDPECRFEDLGNAIRKIRIDLGIPIELRKVQIYAKAPDGKPVRYCAVGEIRYSAVDGEGAQDGSLLYLKPAICGDEPRDILHYKALNEAFPHESTGDQWFSESQFESYRMLGSHVVETICRLGGVTDLAGFLDRAGAYAGGEPEDEPKAGPLKLAEAPTAA
ncbi:MAG TPA: patatin-like phospholipase family protein [Thermoanaerobaculia bacterium]